VWAAEPRPERLRRATDAGAREHTGEPVDIALVCTAKPAAVQAGFRAVAPGGVLVLYGVPEPGDVLTLDALDHLRREVTVVPTYSAGPGDMAAALDLLRGGLAAEGLVTHRVGLDAVGRALELQRTGEALKVLVVP
jgi:threonine dehydrogenase-like Zn-dependent dehydrogenase